MRRLGDRELSDARILGSGKFVELMIKEAQYIYTLPFYLAAQRDGDAISLSYIKIKITKSSALTEFPLNPMNSNFIKI